LTYIRSIPSGEKQSPGAQAAGVFVYAGGDHVTAPIQIYVHFDGAGLRTMMRSAETLATPAKYERALHEGVRAAGDKVRTVVRKTLHKQMGTKKYGMIVKATRSYIPAPMSYAIDGAGKGLPITDFPVKGSKAASVRWSPKEHWRLQKRSKDGRFGAMKAGNDAGVTGRPWSVVHRFARSYQDGEGVFRAHLPGKKKGKGRRLFGPSPAKEIIKDATAAAFERDGPRELETQIGKRLARILAGAVG
jgi:hypothetical protein